jgi:Mlc titration factor MtfA (ptsG expression regulator)
MEITIITLLITGSLVLGTFYIKNKPKWKIPTKPFPQNFKTILNKEVVFYTNLNTTDKLKFEYKIQEFLLNHRIMGIECDLTIEDNLLVAASAIIPIFKIPNWNYSNLYDILIYPDTFNFNHEVKGDDRNVLGMIGTGYMEGKMILSIKALRHGFKNEADKNNTAIHEFVHLIDKLDGVIDGIPSVLLDKQYALPWIHLMEQKINEINENNSDIKRYGGTSKIEFFAVASEYFFERPKLMSKKHPILYQYLEDIFKHDIKKLNLKKQVVKIERNDKCPCGSAKKFKYCCGKNSQLI